MARILLVDDRIESLGWLIVQLEWKGHTVIRATGGDEALKIAEFDTPDLILLDLQMPGMNGLDVCDRLKQSQKTRPIPVMIFTANDNQENLLRSLEYRADWFCSKDVKDFEREFYPIVEALLKRIQADPNKDSKNILHVGDFLTINMKEHIIILNGEIITDMPKKLFDLLVIFARQPNSILTREYVENKVWHPSQRNGAAYPVRDREVDILISRLKSRLKGKADHLFQSIRGQGYRLLPENFSSQLNVSPKNS